ncbi:Lipopolysaccharide assembly protein LapB [hydrothermal vent metagenome]|uniref:Lipopolysaccharide assembly protein LapB n=1 Tax=hydrothermal vent metagenome TaxID=652676 RepID=A0A3B0VNW6_9ZZZZ
MIEIIGFILAALVGIMIGINFNKFKIERKNLKRLEKLNHSYFKGLNYLLNDDSDRAIDVFIELAKTSNETFEPQLALGNLYRRKGEVDKAIKLHQALISQPNLPEDYRTKALLAMGKDYMSAGLLDRAEVLFTELVEIEAYTPEALYSLCEVYQQEQDWVEAIKSASRYEIVSGRKMTNDIAHFNCELAEKAIVAKEYKKAQSYLNSALSINSQCVRAKLIQAREFKQAKKWAKAIAAYHQALEFDDVYASEYMHEMSVCYSQLQKCAEFKKFLLGFIQSYQGISPVLILAQMYKNDTGIEQAEQFVEQQLIEKPSVRGLDLLLKLNLEKNSQSAADVAKFQVLEQLVKKLLDKKPNYRCRKCGFGAKKMHWQCPSCKSWGAVKPIYGLETE